jgi:hypothetical protein
MKPNLRKLIENCVDTGIERGWKAAHKHVDNPLPDEIKDFISDKIMGEIYDYFTFDEETF